MSNSSAVHALAGAGSGLLSLAITYPLYTATVTLQAQSNAHDTTAKKTDQHVATHERKATDELRSMYLASIKHDDSPSSVPRPSSPASSHSHDDLHDSEQRQTLISTLYHLHREHGIVKGWYPGLKAALLANTIQSGIFYYFFALAKQMHNVTTEPSWQMIVGLEAGVANVMLTNPLWVINTRQMTMQKHVHLRKRGLSSADDESDRLDVEELAAQTSWLSCLKYIYRKEGLRGFYSGLGAALALTANPAAQFAIYETLKKYLVALKIYMASRNTIIVQGEYVPGNLSAMTPKFSPMDIFLLGALAKVISTVITYPIQTLKTQMQMSDCSHKSLSDAVLTLWRDGGVRPFFKGMPSKVLQTGITAAFLFLFYDQIVMLTVALIERRQRLQR